MVDVSGCRKSLIFEIPGEEVEDAIHQLALSYTARVKVPGFRPGKVPLGVVKQRFASELRSEATQDLISRSWEQAVSELHLAPLTKPQVEDLHGDPGQPLKFKLSFEVLPQLEISNYNGVGTSIRSKEVDEKEVDLAMEGLRQQHAQYAPVEDKPAADSDLVTVRLDGEFEGGGKPIHDDNINIIVGDPRTAEEFSANLRGARIGDVRSFPVRFSPEHKRKQYAGKTVHYCLEIKDIKEKLLPELNEDFARDMGSGTLEELRSKVRDELVRNAERLAEEKAREEALDEIVRSHSFEVPDSLVAEELQAIAHRVAANLAYEGIDVSRTSINWKDIFEQERPRAEQAARRGMVLDAIARQEHLEVAESELDQEFERLSRTSEKSAVALRAQFEKNQRIHSLRGHLLRNKALDFIFRNANISRG